MWKMLLFANYRNHFSKQDWEKELQIAQSETRTTTHQRGPQEVTPYNRVAVALFPLQV